MKNNNSSYKKCDLLRIIESYNNHFKGFQFIRKPYSRITEKRPPRPKGIKNTFRKLSHFFPFAIAIHTGIGKNVTTYKGVEIRATIKSSKKGVTPFQEYKS